MVSHTTSRPLNGAAFIAVIKVAVRHSCFLFTSGNEIILITQNNHQRNITKRNSQAECSLVLETRKQSMAGLDGTRITNITKKRRTFDVR